MYTVSEYPDQFEDMAQNDMLPFCDEYDACEQGSEFSRLAGGRPDIQRKNRYANILPYDYTRVRLAMNKQDKYSDYINANYIDGYGPSRKRHYIAAQGPNAQTVPDFWQMVWEAETEVIIMVTNCEEKGRLKCNQYWPAAVGKAMRFPTHGLLVEWRGVESTPDYIIRSFAVTLPGNETPRIIKQFHFITWPDHGVPQSTAASMDMLKLAKAERTELGGPMVVHCSAGVGRTGTIIAIDMNLEMIAEKQEIDVKAALNSMRRQRAMMIQTEDQYIFVHKSLLAEVTGHHMAAGT